MSKPRNRFSFRFVSLLVLVASIAGGFASAEASVVNGMPSKVSRPAGLGQPAAIGGFSATMARQMAGATVLVDNGGPCTGVLIHREFVVSAAHCFLNLRNRPAPVLTLHAATSAGLIVLAEYQSFADVRRAMRMAPFNPNSTAIKDDLVLLRLPSPAPIEFSPVPLRTREIRVGETMIQAGFGKSLEERHRWGRLGQDDLNFISGVVQALDSANRSLEIANPRDKANCNGDSGGPIFSFDPATGELAVAGIVTNADLVSPTRRDCLVGGRTVGMNLTAQMDWLRSATQALGSGLEISLAFDSGRKPCRELGDIRQVAVGTVCRARGERTVGIFELVAKSAEGGALWKDLASGIVWSDVLSANYLQEESRSVCARESEKLYQGSSYLVFGLPTSREFFDVFDGRGLREVSAATDAPLWLRTGNSGSAPAVFESSSAGRPASGVAPQSARARVRCRSL